MINYQRPSSSSSFEITILISISYQGYLAVAIHIEGLQHLEVGLLGYVLAQTLLELVGGDLATFVGVKVVEGDVEVLLGNDYLEIACGDDEFLMEVDVHE